MVSKEYTVEKANYVLLVLKLFVYAIFFVKSHQQPKLFV